MRRIWLQLLGENLDVRQIDAGVVRKFAAWIGGDNRDGVDAGRPASPRSDAQRFQHGLYLSAFITWLWQQEILEQLPRNLGDLKVTVKQKAVRIIPLSEVQVVLAAIKNDFHRLYALLVLNTGMQNNDIGNIRESQIVGNLFTMKRGKTSDSENVPTVTYRLWPETLSLLKKFKSRDPHRWLLSSAGTPLYAASYTEDDKPQTSDIVGQQWWRAGYALTLAQLRKVPAQQLADHAKYHEFTSLFLGHAVAGITKSHYAPESARRFLLACDWLRKRILG